KDKQLDVMTQNKNLTNAQVSNVISQMWKNEKKETKLYWKKLADSMKLKHMQNYPDYVYKPKKRMKNASVIKAKILALAHKELSTEPSLSINNQPNINDISY
ncbi:35971_t:CDS:1, partial [Racocetra persica]